MKAPLIKNGHLPYLSLNNPLIIEDIPKNKNNLNPNNDY